MPIIIIIIDGLFTFIFRNLYKKICAKKYAKMKIIEFRRTCIFNLWILNVSYIVKPNNCTLNFIVVNCLI